MECTITNVVSNRTKSPLRTSEAHPPTEGCVGAVTGVVVVALPARALVEARAAGTLAHTPCNKQHQQSLPD